MQGSFTRFFIQQKLKKSCNVDKFVPILVQHSIGDQSSLCVAALKVSEKNLFSFGNRKQEANPYSVQRISGGFRFFPQHLLSLCNVHQDGHGCIILFILIHLIGLFHWSFSGRLQITLSVNLTVRPL